MAVSALSRMEAGMLSSFGEPGRRKSTVMASSSARRGSRRSIEDADEATSKADWASGERNLSAMAASLEVDLAGARQPHIGLTRPAIWS